MNQPLDLDAVLASADQPGWWTMPRPAVNLLIARVRELEAALATARSDTYTEAARILENTGWDDDAVNTLDTLAAGIRHDATGCTGCTQASAFNSNHTTEQE